MAKVSFYPLPKVGGALPLDRSVPKGKSQAATDGRFGEILNKEIGRTQAVKFSAHATSRLAERNIRMTDAETERLQSAVDRADAKGSRDSLVLMDDVALIVSVRNRTVVTAMDREQMKESVVTNIDSTVMA